jgi:Thioredoxin
MFCIAALLVLSILGIFSATNRALAHEALDCVLRRVTFRPCTTGFDTKMKSKIVGGLITRSAPLAKFINKYFEVLSWIFVVLFIASLFFSIRGGYLFYTTGSCNGLNESGFCVFDPKGEANKTSGISCPTSGKSVADLTLAGVDLSTFAVKNPTSTDKIVFIGCYECDYSRKSYPIMMKLVDRFSPNFVFAHFPVKQSTTRLSEIAYCVYQQDQAKYWQLNDLFFSADISNLEKDSWVQDTLKSIGVDTGAVNACLFDSRTSQIIKNQVTELEKTHLFGTPTIFINGQPMVGPKPFRVYAIALKGFFFWLQK